MDLFSLYVHIPFCERKCHYCDFVSFSREYQNISRYIDNLLKEISLYKTSLSNYRLDTIFIGGGTPSCIDSKYIEEILSGIYNNFNIRNQPEVSIEVNPGTLDFSKAQIYKNIGINRVSLGVQSLNDNILKSIGRIHNSDDFLESLEILRNVGFKNINVDLMFGLPNQIIEDLEISLHKVVDLKMEHISLYGLIIEKSTLLDSWYKKGVLQVPSEDLERNMYHRSIELLTSRGYNHYEISNFSKPSYECRHNLTYWKLKPYLGVGLSSHSNLFGKRYWNYSNLNSYNNLLEKNILPIEDEETINKSMEMAEYCILGLRLLNGINKVDFKNRFDTHIENNYKDVIVKHKTGGLIIEDIESIKLTSKGLDLANIVEVDFIP